MERIPVILAEEHRAPNSGIANEPQTSHETTKETGETKTEGKEIIKKKRRKRKRRRRNLPFTSSTAPVIEDKWYPYVERV